ncbi:MAG: aminomethyl-transferring glycine dehydrogenase subunit GcvPA [Gammaproteobacteria bacterium]|nr:aminomethyl-transferring glycine dehydrogenase subunit GcvPA [Gammaproteobacteria bacterium]
MQAEPRAHPFMPNSTAELKQELLAVLGIDSVDQLFAQIPREHRLRNPLDLPEAMSSEVDLSRHMRGKLGKNISCQRALSFLGGGCWQHHVPAVCDEIAQRSEFLTPVWGTVASDLGRNQAWFEFTSQLGELLSLELVALPVYSWGCAAGNAIRMAARMTGRNKVLLPRYLCPERRAVINSYCEPPEMHSHISIVDIDVDPETGLLNLESLERRLADDVAAVYFENPSYLGQIESQAMEISAMARRHGAETIVGVDPVSLGILEPPGEYGADIVVGSIQPLGIHMNCGGGLGGFIASRDEPRYAHEYPALMISITETPQGDYGFSMVLMHQCSYGSREKAKDWTGNSTYLWAIVCAVYMALLGPRGFRELGELIIQRAHYCAHLLGKIDGVRVLPRSGFFKEFVVNFDSTGKQVHEINRALLKHGIFGGLDLSRHFPELGQSALFCVTEMHNEQDLMLLAEKLREVCSS